MSFKPMDSVNGRMLTPEENPHSFAVFDRDDPNSMWSKISDTGKGAIDSVPKYLRTWGIKALEKKLGDKLTPQLRQLRISLWREFADAVETGKSISLESVKRGICNKVFLYEHVLRTPQMMAYIVTPPANYSMAMQELLDISINNLRDIITTRHHPKTGGPPNVALMALKLRAHEMIENRVRGVAPKTVNINQKSMHMRVDSQKPAAVTSLSDAELESEIKRLRGQIKKLPKSVQQEIVEMPPPDEILVEAKDLDSLGDVQDTKRGKE